MASQIGLYIHNGLIILGSLVAAFVMVQFVWFLAEYAFFGGNDQERLHAKQKLIEATTSIWLLMIAWLIAGFISNISLVWAQGLASLAVLIVLALIIINLKPPGAKSEEKH